MSKVYKKVEIVGVSETSFSDAVQAAVKKASETIEHISWFEVAELRGAVSDGVVTQYQATVKLGFRVEAHD